MCGNYVDHEKHFCESVCSWIGTDGSLRRPKLLKCSLYSKKPEGVCGARRAVKGADGGGVKKVKEDSCCRVSPS